MRVSFDPKYVCCKIMENLMSVSENISSPYCNKTMGAAASIVDEAPRTIEENGKKKVESNFI